MASIHAADDSIFKRQFLAITLRGDGHELMLAEDGAAALAIAGTTKYNLAIVDLQMPRIVSISLTRKLRRMPVLIVSRFFTDHGIVHRLQGCGARSGCQRLDRRTDTGETVSCTDSRGAGREIRMNAGVSTP